MNTLSDRVVLLVLALVAAYVGAWALFAPASFYAEFPGGSRHWVAADGPFNEHLVRDVGAAYCALCVLSVAALVRRGSPSGRRVWSGSSSGCRTWPTTRPVSACTAAWTGYSTSSRWAAP